MSKVVAGAVAGFAATAVLSIMMLAKAMMGLMPQMDVIVMLSAMMSAPPAVGWLAHFMIGTVAWGVGFAFVQDHLPGGSLIVKGLAFGTAAWLGMMILVMPMAGAGLFGMALGMMAPVMTLMLHWVFGLVLGGVYGGLTAPKLSHA